MRREENYIEKHVDLLGMKTTYGILETCPQRFWFFLLALNYSLYAFIFHNKRVKNCWCQNIHFTLIDALEQKQKLFFILKICFVVVVVVAGFVLLSIKNNMIC